MEEAADAERARVEQPGAQNVRFEATVHVGRGQMSLAAVADLDMDRLPDPEGAVRLLLTPDDAVTLVGRGYEVHLVEVHPVRPFDASLVTDEGAALEWLEKQVEGIPREQSS